ncbi:MAG: DNA primase [Bacteroidales bacterium]|jgi:DNA primase|nr:DNA primase [Bacteroidales bacterium]
MISKQTIDEILSIAKIDEVVGDFVTLKRRGQNFVGTCPFHDDKNPSMYVSPRLGIYNCFVCDAKGGAAKFLMEHEKISYPEALRYLAKKYNIAIQEEEEKTFEQKTSDTLRESLFLLNDFAEKYFVDQLWNSDEGKTYGLSYFRERDLSESTIKKFRLGYCPSGWDQFTQIALKSGYKEEFLTQLGLTKKSESGKLFDFYHGRVIFPIHNGLGKIVGFGARILQKNEKSSKYFNSPESEIYHKSEILYGYYFAKKSIRAKDNVYLVEGYTDVISMVQSGIENVVASSGTALTERQIKLIASQTQNITVLYDGDNAGIKASLRGIDMLLQAGLNVKVALLPDGEDPDSFARKHRASELTAFLEENTTDFLLFKVKVLSKEAGKDPVKRAAMVNEMINSIADVRDAIARMFYVKECASIFELPEETLNAQLRKVIWKKIHAQDSTEPVSDVVINPVTPRPELHTFKEDPLKNIEKNMILLILKYGMFDIDIERFDDEEKPFYEKMRIDQYIFDELYEENVLFANALFQKIFEEYPDIALLSEDQDEIKKRFSSHEDTAIQEFAIQHLLNTDPTYSPDWENKFDVITNTLDNNQKKLTDNVEHHVNLFKLRVLEKYREQLMLELSQPHPELSIPEQEEVTNNITKKLIEVLEKRKMLAHNLGLTISR